MNATTAKAMVMARHPQAQCVDSHLRRGKNRFWVYTSLDGIGVRLSGPCHSEGRAWRDAAQNLKRGKTAAGR